MRVFVCIFITSFLWIHPLMGTLVVPLIIANIVAINGSACISSTLFLFSLVIYAEVELLAHTVDLFFIF